MARVKLSALFTAIAGRYGGGVFRAWKGLVVLAALPNSVRNPNSTKQAAVRALFSCASKIWAGLAHGARTDWATVAAYLTGQWENFENEVGTHRVITTPRGPYTALGALTSVCSLLGSVGAWDCEAAAPAAPIGHTAPAAPTDLEISGTTAGIVCVWNDPGSWGDQETDGDVRIWLADDAGTVFAQLSGSVAGGVETYTIVNAVPTGGDTLRPLEIGYYYVQIDAVNEGGLRSAPSNVAQIELIDPIV